MRAVTVQERSGDRTMLRREYGRKDAMEHDYPESPSVLATVEPLRYMEAPDFIDAFNCLTFAN